MAQSNPVLGIGRGQFMSYTGLLIAHNSAVEIMGESGFVGLLLWLGIIYCGMKGTLLAAREAEDPVDRAYARSVALSVAGYVVSSMFVTLEYETFYFLLALAAASGNGLEEPARFRDRDALIMLAIVAGFFIMLKTFVMAYA
jgi:O-antigen ligase